jgi:hydrogenase maturation factor HypF (carbamoyltransferase family)
MRFHRAVADFTAAVCRSLAAASGLRQVALSGGVFQNTLLLGEIVARLRAAGLDAYYHRRVPTNDGGLAFGQQLDNRVTVFLVVIRDALDRPAQSISCHNAILPRIANRG